MRNENIEVFLRRVGPQPTKYMEYTHPDQVRKFQSQTTQCYVEAKTDERFQIHVRLLHGFRYYTASCIEIRLWLDAHKEPDVYLCKKVRIPADGKKHFEYTLKDFMVQIGDHWENGKLCFGDVQIDEDKDKMFRRSELRDRSNKLGKITVSVQRGRQDADPSNMAEPESVALDGVVSPADHLKGITHHVKTVGNRPVENPENDKSNLFKRTAGPHGERCHFEFRYRSREQLKRLGMMDEEGKRIDLNVDDGDGGELPVIPAMRSSPPVSSPLVGYKRRAENLDSSPSPAAKKRSVVQTIDLTGSASPAPASAPTASSPENMSETELQMEMRRLEVQQRQYDLEQKQLEAEKKMLDYKIQLEKSKRGQ